ncbi:MAG TPA: thioredoxin domain-containing protein, partial [Bacteroidia bacterium]|nr:thioredoxin domain-containing protein [Bacteroidia bacterium]
MNFFKTYFSKLFFTAILFSSCHFKTDTKSPQNMDKKQYQFTNHLIHESSPYLLQHAHNPVDWYPWGDSALEKAKKENKLLLISIGYSACHWCHVMEHECFEDTSVANIMNKYFVCIKVDREERPDIDQVYMNAVQLMTGSGGWPLNCFALPNGKPFYGGTYYPKAEWKNLLTNIADTFKLHPEKIIEYANHLTEGVQKSELITKNLQPDDFNADFLTQVYKKWETSFDTVYGGPNHAPKFPLPNNYEFLLSYYSISKDKSVLKQVELTLDKMAEGGIFDQVGGGFARYSTDALWKVPHFEKMLYDNAQLVSLYSQAFQLTKKKSYKQVVDETLAFIAREMTSQEGAFYSSIDADSEGKEGKFYVWTKAELQQIIGSDFNLFSEYYNVNSLGYWEDGNYILLRKSSDEVFAKTHDISVEKLESKVQEFKNKLLAARNKRVRPSLDDKSLTSWNALMLKAYVDAYKAFGEKKYLDAALKNANFILKNQLRADGGLNHNYKSGISSINGYLDDYSFTIQSFISLYQCTFDEKWLTTSNQLAAYCITHFQDKNSGMFYFTSNLDSALIARKTELMDNVIPASNSSLANDLFMLGYYFDNTSYISMSKQMLNNVKPF